MNELQLLKDYIFDSYPGINAPKALISERLKLWFFDITNDRDRINQLAKDLGSIELKP